MLGYTGSVYRYLPGHVKNGIVILLCIFESIIIVLTIDQYLKTQFCRRKALLFLCWGFKDLNSTVTKRGSVFIGLMTSDGAIRFRYQRAVLMR